MMTNKKRVKWHAAVLVITILMIAQGCAYTHIQRPLDMDFQETTLGNKTGKSHTHTVLWLVAWGDGGTRAAAESGGIERIHHADIEVLMILFGLYTRVTTVVYGD